MNALKTATLSLLVTSMIACGDSDDNNKTSTNTNPVATSSDVQSSLVTISGKAATGAALQGNVVAMNAKGDISDSVKVSPDGSYSLQISEGAPYMIKAVSNNLKGTDGKPLELFSYSEKGGFANITTLTTQALFSASNQGNLKTIFDNWKTSASSVTAAKVKEAANKVLVNLKNEFTEAGLTNPDIFATDFKTDGTGLDKVLDKFKANYTCASINSCSVTYMVDGQTYEWNYDADTNTITSDLSNTEASGKYTLTTKTTISSGGFAAGQPITNVLNNVAKPDNESQFCGTMKEKSALPKEIKFSSCTFDGNTGRITGSTKKNGFKFVYELIATFSL